MLRLMKKNVGEDFSNDDNKNDDDNFNYDKEILVIGSRTTVHVIQPCC